MNSLEWAVLFSILFGMGCAVGVFISAVESFMLRDPEGAEALCSALGKVLEAAPKK